MGVYIKGMEMPECCDKCPFKSYVGLDYLKCRINGIRFYAWEVGWGEKPYVRHESCPLIALPPHGRLIDADALRKEFPEPTDFSDFNEVMYHVTGIWATIDCAPTIIPAEEAYNKYTDTAGNLHWTGTISGEHTIRAAEGE